MKLLKNPIPPFLEMILTLFILYIVSHDLAHLMSNNTFIFLLYLKFMYIEQCSLKVSNFLLPHSKQFKAFPFLHSVIFYILKKFLNYQYYIFFSNQDPGVLYLLVYVSHSLSISILPPDQ